MSNLLVTSYELIASCFGANRPAAIGVSPHGFDLLKDSVSQKRRRTRPAAVRSRCCHGPRSRTAKVPSLHHLAPDEEAASSRISRSYDSGSSSWAARLEVWRLVASFPIGPSSNCLNQALPRGHRRPITHRAQNPSPSQVRQFWRAAEAAISR